MPDSHHPTPRAPLRLRDGDEATTVDTTGYLVRQTPGQPLSLYQPQPGAHLAPGPQGQPAYYYPQQAAPRPGADPRLINTALVAVIALVLCVGLWFAAAFVAALAALLKAAAVLLLVLAAITVVIKSSGGRVRVDVETRTGRGRRRRHSTRVRVR